MSLRDGSASRCVSDPLNRRRDRHTYPHTHTHTDIYIHVAANICGALSRSCRTVSALPPNEESVCLHRVITGVPHLTGGSIDRRRESVHGDSVKRGVRRVPHRNVEKASLAAFIDIDRHSNPDIVPKSSVTVFNSYIIRPFYTLQFLKNAFKKEYPSFDYVLFLFRYLPEFFSLFECALLTAFFRYE